MGTKGQQRQGQQEGLWEGAVSWAEMAGNKAILSGSAQDESLGYFLFLKCCHGQDILLQHSEGFAVMSKKFSLV